METALMSHKNSQENNKTMYGEIVFTRKYISGKCAYMLRCIKSAHAQITKSATSVALCHINNVYYLYLLSLCSVVRQLKAGVCNADFSTVLGLNFNMCMITTRE